MKSLCCVRDLWVRGRICFMRIGGLFGETFKHRREGVTSSRGGAGEACLMIFGRLCVDLWCGQLFTCWVRLLGNGIDCERERNGRKHVKGNLSHVCPLQAAVLHPCILRLLAEHRLHMTRHLLIPQTMPRERCG